MRQQASATAAHAHLRHSKRASLYDRQWRTGRACPSGQVLMHANSDWCGTWVGPLPPVLSGENSHQLFFPPRHQIGALPRTGSGRRLCWMRVTLLTLASPRPSGVPLTLPRPHDFAGRSRRLAKVHGTTRFCNCPGPAAAAHRGHNVYIGQK